MRLYSLASSCHTWIIPCPMYPWCICYIPLKNHSLQEPSWHSAYLLALQLPQPPGHHSSFSLTTLHSNKLSSCLSAYLSLLCGPNAMFPLTWVPSSSIRCWIWTQLMSLSELLALRVFQLNLWKKDMHMFQSRCGSTSWPHVLPPQWWRTAGGTLKSPENSRFFALSLGQLKLTKRFPLYQALSI